MSLSSLGYQSYTSFNAAPDNELHVRAITNHRVGRGFKLIVRQVQNVHYPFLILHTDVVSLDFECLQYLLFEKISLSPYTHTYCVPTISLFLFTLQEKNAILAITLQNINTKMTSHVNACVISFRVCASKHPKDSVVNRTISLRNFFASSKFTLLLHVHLLIVTE